MSALKARSSFACIQILDWFIPEQHGLEAEDLTRRARMLVAVMVLGLASLSWTVIYQLQFGSRAFGIVSLSIIPCVLLSGFALRWGVSVRTMTSISVAVFYLATFSVGWLTGGAWPGGLYFLALVPAVAIGMVGIRAGAVWAGVSLASILCLWGLNASGTLDARITLQPEVVAAGNFRIAFLLTAGVYGLTTFFASLHRNANDAWRRSAENHQRGERRFRALAENTYDLIMELDDQGIITYASPGFDEAIGQAPENLIGCGILKSVHPDDEERALAYWSELHEKGRVQQSPIRFLTVSRGYRWFEISMRSYQSIEEGGLRFVAVARDVTERLSQEKLMRHQENLVSMGTMTAGAVHQLNSPLASILLAAEHTVRIHPNGDLSPLARGALQGIAEDAKKCGQVLRAMLRFSREEPTERWLEKLDTIIYRAIGSVETKDWQIGPEIVLSLCSEDAWVLMSPIEIEQVLINLIRNSIDAGSKVIVIGTEVIRDECVRVTLSDDGEGVHTEEKEKIFDSFFTTRPETGTGLGLSIARSIIEEHSGRIELLPSELPDDQGDEGAVFRFELPLAEAPAPRIH